MSKAYNVKDKNQTYRNMSYDRIKAPADVPKSQNPKSSVITAAHDLRGGKK